MSKSIENGTNVRLKTRPLIWMLNNPDTYVKPSGTVDPAYYEYMELATLRLLGWDFDGVVTHQGIVNCVKVKWNVPRGFKSFTSYFDSKDLVVVK